MDTSSSAKKFKKRGNLEVICGSMFSGKTEELMRQLQRYEYAKQRILTISHKIDIRHGKDIISSHAGGQRTAISIDGTPDGVSRIITLASESDVVGIDEVQFFPQIIISVIKTLIENGKQVVAAGLDLDFRGEPFGVIPPLMAIADKVTKLKAICVVCTEDAYQSQRLVNGKPAKFDDPTILVGAAECYEARCRSCFYIDKQPIKEAQTQV